MLGARWFGDWFILARHDEDGQVGSGPYLSSLGTGKFNLSSPAGIARNHIFQSFHDARNSIAKSSERTQLELDVDVFTWSTGCQQAAVELRNSTDSMNSVGLAMTSNGCEGIHRIVGEQILYAAPIQNQIGESYEDWIGTSIFRASLQSCKNEHLFEYRELDYNRGMDLRFWGLLSSVAADGHPFFWSRYNRTDFYKFAAVMCTPSYTMTHNRVSLWQETYDTPLNSSVGIGTERRLIPQITGGDILYAVDRSISVSDTRGHSSSRREEIYLSTPMGEVQRYIDQVLLAKEINETIASIAVRVVKQYLLKPTDIRAVGNMSDHEDRLVMRPISFGFMAGVLVILIAISGALLWYYLPVSACSRDPGSIGGFATILARSPGLTALVHDMDISQVSDMEQLLVKQSFYTKAENDMSFGINVDGKGVTTPRRNLSEDINWWRPLPSKRTVRAFILIVPAAITCASELLYRLSTRATGLHLLAEQEPSYYQFVWAYIPAILMFCVRSLLVTVEFSTRLLQPFHILRRGGARVRTSILANQHRKIAAAGLIEALAQRHVSLAVAIFALLLSSFLPITVSSLYSLNHQWVPASHMNSSLIHMNRAITHEVDLENSTLYTLEAHRIPGMLLHLNLSYPQWTYEDLSFPKLKLSVPVATDISANQTNIRIVSRLPAIRFGLVGRPLSSSEYSTDDPEHGSLIINVPRDEPIVSKLTAEVSEGAYFSEYSSGFSLDSLGGLLVYGKMHASENRPETMVILGCNGTVEEVLNETQFALPDYTIIGRPRIIEGSVTPIPKSFLFPPEDGMEMALRGLNSIVISNDTTNLGAVFQAAIYGVSGVPAAELLHPEKLSKALGRVYSITVAQMFNNWGYVDLNETEAIAYNKSSSGMILQDRRSLRQDEISTRILQSLLAVIIACGIINMVLMDTKRVLPKNPCSIGALASLLAGSRMLKQDVIPPGSEWHDNKGLKKRGVFAGRTFTMGFWDREGNTQFNSQRNDNNDRIEEEEIGTKRFGIDVDKIKQA